MGLGHLWNFCSEAQAPRVQGIKNQFREPKAPSTSLADGEEAAEPVPVEVEPVEVEVAPGAEPEEVGHVAVAAREDPGRAEGDDRELPLDFGVRGPEHQEFRDRRRAHPERLEVGEHPLGAGVLVQVHQFEVGVGRTVARHGEVARRDVAVAPVVVTGRDHLFDRLPVVDDDRVGTHLPTRGNPIGVTQEGLEVLPRHAAGLRLGDKLAQLLYRDFHGVSPWHLLPNSSTPGDLPSIFLLMVDRHLQVSKGCPWSSFDQFSINRAKRKPRQTRC